MAFSADQQAMVFDLCDSFEVPLKPFLDGLMQMFVVCALDLVLKVICVCIYIEDMESCCRAYGWSCVISNWLLGHGKIYDNGMEFNILPK